jgi:transcriptional adapter 2-alpha
MIAEDFLQTGGKKVVYNCGFCSHDITQSFRAKCAVCEDVFLCIDCFSAGVTFFPHKSSHEYRLPDCLEFPIFSKDWMVNEELLLLEGITIIFTIVLVTYLYFIYK